MFVTVVNNDIKVYVLIYTKTLIIKYLLRTVMGRIIY